MDIVYVNRHGENPELRYSLRSLRNVDHDLVWVFGGAPVWLNQSTVYHRERMQAGSPYASTRGHIEAACNTPEVSDPFMLWNDDFYAMRKVGRVPVYHRGSLLAMLEEFATSKTGWVKGLRETASMLDSRGMLASAMSYDTHLPLIVHKAPMRESLRWAAKARTDAVHLRTLYGAVAGLTGIEHVDPKMIRRTDPFPPGAWLSSGDHTFRSVVEPVVRYVFPNESPYEMELS